MKRAIPLAALVLLASLRAQASEPPASAKPADPTQDVITPLDVRDPSALIMGPGGQPISVTIQPPGPARPAVPGPVEAAKSAVDKSGPRLGERAVALPMDEDQLLGVKPGDRVDVIAVFDAVSSSGARERFSVAMLQNERVLGVVTTRDLRAKGVLTLEVNPIEAQYALLGARQAELGLAVRAPGDVEIHPAEMSGFRRFFR